MAILKQLETGAFVFAKVGQKTRFAQISKAEQMPRICERCGKRPAAVPDRERMGRPILRICAECHRGALAVDVVGLLLHHAREGVRRHEEANEKGQESHDSRPDPG